MKKRLVLPILFLLTLSPSDVHAQSLQFALTTGFSSAMSSGTGATFDTNFKGIGDLNITLLATQNGINHQVATDTGFPVAGNPTGWPNSVTWFYPRRVGVNALCTYRFTFASPLTTTDRFVLADFDFSEVGTIQAWDTNNNLIDLSTWSFSRFNGLNGTPGTESWNVSGVGNTTGMLAAGGITNQAFITLTPGLSMVGRIEYTVNQTAAAGDTAFQFTSVSAPEPNSISLIVFSLVLFLIKRNTKVRRSNPS